MKSKKLSIAGKTIFQWSEFKIEKLYLTPSRIGLPGKSTG